MRWGQTLDLTPEELKAFSQNLGHEDVLTTFRSYGQVPTDRQGEIMKNIGRNKASKGQAREALKTLEELISRAKIEMSMNQPSVA